MSNWLEVVPGNVVRCSCVFTNTSGEPTDPTTVTLRIITPDAEELLPTVVNDTAPGAFYADVPIPGHATAAGRWHRRWEGDGAVVAAVEGWWTVLASEFL
jgi:hypothetical protein